MNSSTIENILSEKMSKANLNQENVNVTKSTSSTSKAQKRKAAVKISAKKSMKTSSDDVVSSHSVTKDVDEDVVDYDRGDIDDNYDQDENRTTLSVTITPLIKKTKNISLINPQPLKISTIKSDSSILSYSKFQLLEYEIFIAFNHRILGNILLIQN